MKVLKWTLVAAFLMGAHLIALEPTLAIDEDSKSAFAFGVGTKKCSVYVQFRERKLPGQYSAKDYENTEEVVAQWVGGFMTAHNYYVQDTYDVTKNAGKDMVMGWLESLCRENPEQPFALAVIELARRLHPNRIQDRPMN